MAGKRSQSNPFVLSFLTLKVELYDCNPVALNREGTGAGSIRTAEGNWGGHHGWVQEGRINRSILGYFMKTQQICTG